MLPTKEELMAALQKNHLPAAAAKLQGAKVGIAGAGGLGSNLAMYLARMGIGYLHIIDFDRVELSNLNRQHYFLTDVGQPKAEALRHYLLEVNPFLEVRTEVLQVTAENAAELFGEVDIICEAFDRPEAKAMLVSTLREKFPHKPLVAVSGLAGFGPANEIQTRQVGKNFYLVGDGKTELEGQPLSSARVAIAAAHEAQVVARLVLGLEAVEKVLG